MSNKKLKKNIRTALVWSVILCFYTFALLFFESHDPNSNIKDTFDAVWYTIVTLTSVGYGDFYPVTTGGKILGLTAVLGSLGVLSFIISKITIKYSEYMEKKKNGHYGTKFTKHFVIIGWDSFSKQVTNQIIKSKNKVIVVTDTKNDVDLIHDLYHNALVDVLYADYNNYEILAKANIEDSSKVFVNFPDDAESLIHIINIQKQYHSIDFVVTLNSTDLKDTFKSVGVSYIVSKNEIASNLVASYIFEPDAAVIIEDLMETSHADQDTDVVQFKMTSESPFVGSKCLDAFVKLKTDFNSVLIGIAKGDASKEIIKNPNGSVPIELNDYLIILTQGASKDQLTKTFGINEGRID
jgi:voltage-gated potassium channel